jgi:two-component system cell cycle sensor histidine kinase/response regulator CckA
VIAGAERAAYLTRQLLAYSGKGAFTVERIDVGRLIRDMEPLLRASVPETIALQLETPENLPEIEADAEQIRQALMNLAINAAEAIGEHNRGCVHIRTGQHDLGSDEIRRDFSREELIPGSYVAIEVRDTGIGMDESIRSRIFDPFFTTKFLGRGLGLAAVWGIVRAGRGAIRVSSAPGKGSTFQVLLPAAARRFARQI